MFVSFLLVVLEMKKPDYDKNLLNFISGIFLDTVVFWCSTRTTLFFSLKKT